MARHYIQIHDSHDNIWLICLEDIVAINTRSNGDNIKSDYCDLCIKGVLGPIEIYIDTYYNLMNAMSEYMEMILK